MMKFSREENFLLVMTSDFMMSVWRTGSWDLYTAFKLREKEDFDLKEVEVDGEYLACGHINGDMSLYDLREEKLVRSVR